MANLIRIKRSGVTGRTPTISDLQLGELAINTYDGKLFAKKNNGSESVIEIGSGVGDGDKGDITVSTGGTVWTVDNQAITFPKIQNVTSNRLLGRSTSGLGSMEEISIGSGLSLTSGTLSVSNAAGIDPVIAGMIF